jgi:Mor family transcriptional regulator
MQDEKILDNGIRASGARAFYQERNREIQKRFHEGYSIDVLSDQYGLAYSTIKKIIYG